MQGNARFLSISFKVFLVFLALALYEQLQAGSPAMAQTAAAFGIIWATLVIASGMVANIGTIVVVDLYGQDPALAAPVWLAIDTVRNGLGSENEILGGLWVLLVSWAGLRSGALPRALKYFGVLISVAGLLTVIPALGEIGGIIFGLGTIVWFVWLGIVMLSGKPRAA